MRSSLLWQKDSNPKSANDARLLQIATSKNPHGLPWGVVSELSAGVPAGKADTIEICAGGRWRNFLEKLSLYTFQYECRELQEISAQIIPEASGMRMPQASAGSRDSAEASDGKGNSWLRILISENLCNDRKTAGYHAVFSSLKAIVSLLMNFDWEADKAGVYRLFQANAKS